MDHHTFTFRGTIPLLEAVSLAHRIMGISRSEFLRMAVGNYLASIKDDLKAAQDKNKEDYRHYLDWLNTNHKT